MNIDINWSLVRFSILSICGGYFPIQKLTFTELIGVLNLSCYL